VLVVLYDDTGQAAWSPYGGRITMPTMDRLAANGLTYSQCHTTSVCSPTRSTMLTGRNHHYPDTTEIPEASAASTLGRSFKFLAEVELTRDSKGVIVAQGSSFGGYTMFLTDTEVVFVYNFLGIPPEQRLAGPKPPPGRHLIGVGFVKETISEHNECLGTMTLHVDDQTVDKQSIRTQTGHYAICGEGLCVGYDSGDRVSGEYEGRNRFTTGDIIMVVYDIGDDAYVDLELKFAARLARD